MRKRTATARVDYWKTDDFIRREAARIKHVAGWPMWPYLPMKHCERREGGGSVLGFMMAGDDNYFPKKIAVYIGILAYGNIRDSASLPQETFSSVEDMIRAGWIGD